MTRPASRSTSLVSVGEARAIAVTEAMIRPTATQLAPADRLAEDAVPEVEQEQEAEGQRRLDEGQRGEGQGQDLDRPAGDRERRRPEPDRPPQQMDQQARPSAPAPSEPCAPRRPAGRSRRRSRPPRRPPAPSRLQRFVHRWQDGRMRALVPTAGLAGAIWSAPALAPVVPAVAGGLRPAADDAEASAEAVALTFDDGPDPAGTPAILEILARHGARATFFCVGEQVERSALAGPRDRRRRPRPGDPRSRPSQPATADAAGPGRRPRPRPLRPSARRSAASPAPSTGRRTGSSAPPGSASFAAAACARCCGRGGATTGAGRLDQRPADRRASCCARHGRRRRPAAARLRSLQRARLVAAHCRGAAARPRGLDARGLTTRALEALPRAARQRLCPRCGLRRSRGCRRRRAGGPRA